MEAIFHEDPRVQEWLDLIIEKLFTACLLSGPDEEKELQKGCNTVAKVALALQSVPSFPSPMIYDGIQQLIEQRLPDPRVIDNFPMFNSLMDKMLKEGIQSINNIQAKDDQENAIPAMATVTPASPISPSSNIRLRDVVSLGQNNLDKITIKITSEGKRYEIPLTPQIQITQQIDHVLKENKDITSQRESEYESGTKKEVYNKEFKEFIKESIEIIETKAPKEPMISDENKEEFKEEINFILEPNDTTKNLKTSPSEELNKHQSETELMNTNVAALPQKPVKEDIQNSVKVESNFENIEKKDTVTDILTNKANEKESQKEKPKANLQSLISKVTQKETKTEDNTDIKTESIVPKSKIIKKSNIPSGAEKFAFILKQLYPNSKVRWNRTLAGYDFLAQVEDLLFCLKNTETNINQMIKEMKEQGWKVITFANEDLQFPRRIEREISFQLKQKIRRS